MTCRIPILFPVILLFLSCQPAANKDKQEKPVKDYQKQRSRSSHEDTISIDSDVFIIGDKTKIAADSISYVGVRFKPYIRFSDFEVPIENDKEKASIKFSSNPSARMFKTRIREGYKDGVNFGGHYCFVEWGCGSPCHESVIVDVKTGIVYDGPSTAYGYDFKKGSRMVIGSPPGSDGFYLGGTSEVPSIYIWNEHKKNFEERLPLYR
jgi:hypothetical protein